MLGTFLGTKKLPEGTKPPPPNPMALHATDYAWWLRNSALHLKPQEWTEQDEVKYRANNVLTALGLSRKQDHPREFKQIGHDAT